MEKLAPPELPLTCRKKINILHLEDIPDDSNLCALELRRSQFDATIEVVQTAEEFSAQLTLGCFDVVLADYKLQGWNGMQAFELFRKLGCKSPFILVTGAIGEEKVAECMREGVSDFVFKQHLGRLPMVIQRSISEQLLREDHEHSAAALRES